MSTVEQIQTKSEINLDNLLLRTRKVLARGALSLAMMTGIGVAIEGGSQVVKPNRIPVAAAESGTDCGAVLLKGSEWLGGNGVDVHSNGQYQTYGESCGGEDPIHNLDASPPQYGLAWQCAELATRLWAARGWGTGLWLGPNGGAKLFYTKAANGDWTEKGISAKANGSGYMPVPGDMIVHSNGTYGHVVIFDHFDGNTAWAVGQNDKDPAGNYASWVTYAWDPNTGTISKSGKTISGFVHSDKNTFTNSGVPASNPAPPASGEPIPLNAIGETGEFYSQEGWVYTKVGGRAWPIKHKNNWTQADTAKWGQYPGGPVPTAEVHDNEVGWSGTGLSEGAHPPGHKTTVFVDGGNGTQYYFHEGRAYPITIDELDDLGVRGQAKMIPAGDRLDDFLGRPFLVENGMLIRKAGTAAVRQIFQQPDGSWKSFWANNDTVLDCVRFMQGKEPIILPKSASNDAVFESSQPVACAFPSGMILHGPSGAEQWRITGDNSSEAYVRHYYPNSLLTYLHTDGRPDLRQLRSAGAINNIAQGYDMAPPPGAFFRNTANGEVFAVIDGIYKKVPSPDTLTCSGNPHIIEIPGNVMEGMPQSGTVSCNYAGRIIYGPDGRQYYIDRSTNRRQPIGNTALSACIKGRRGTGEPVPVSASTISDYIEDSRGAWCPWGTEVGLNFVFRAGSPDIYKVRPNGELLHVGSMCPNPSGDKRLTAYSMPPGEFDGSRTVGTWWASPTECHNLVQKWEAVGG